MLQAVQSVTSFCFFPPSFLLFPSLSPSASTAHTFETRWLTALPPTQITCVCAFTSRTSTSPARALLAPVRPSARPLAPERQPTGRAANMLKTCSNSFACTDLFTSACASSRPLSSCHCSRRFCSFHQIEHCKVKQHRLAGAPKTTFARARPPLNLTASRSTNCRDLELACLPGWRPFIISAFAKVSCFFARSLAEDKPLI